MQTTSSDAGSRPDSAAARRAAATAHRTYDVGLYVFKMSPSATRPAIAKAFGPAAAT